MPQTYGQCSLYLYPEQKDFTAETLSSLISELQEICFLSQPVDRNDEYDFFTGDKFLNHIAYMGCAPAIKFEADPDDEGNDADFCHIKIHRHKTSRLICSQKQSTTPRCPHCKKPVRDWQDDKTAATIKCNQCGTTSNIEDFDWRKMAGYAQLFIEITDIFPKEAIPQKILLDRLTDITNTEWKYFYSCQ